MLRCNFQTDNSAFDDGDSGRLESARILRDLADKLEHGSTISGGIYDANGNRVGSWSYDGTGNAS